MSATLVLVITNDPGLRSLLRVCLSGNGHRLDMAPNVLDAVTRLSQTRYDAILLDYDRAEIGGMTVLQHIQDHHPHIPVVLMLEHGSTVAAQCRRVLGVQACLVKPFNPQAIEQILNSCPTSFTQRPARRAQFELRLDGQKSVLLDQDGQSRVQEMAAGRKGSA